MQNKLLSITHNIIPYVKELRPLAGSVTAVLLWQQLDYWFARSSNSFYKFLSPPQTNHEKYKPGDSWTEELGFSEKEFRNAFDKIGVRHTSKGAYDKAENPFIKNGKEFYFCSYHDKQKGLTFYFRNNDLTDKALDTLVHSGDAPVTDQREVTELTKVKLQNSPKVSSTIYTETTPENNNNETVVVDENLDKLTAIFTLQEQPAAKKMLATISTENQLEVLMVLTVMIKTSQIKNKVGYLRTLVQSVNDNTFTPLPENLKPITLTEQLQREQKAKKEENARHVVDNLEYFKELYNRFKNIDVIPQQYRNSVLEKS